MNLLSKFFIRLHNGLFVRHLGVLMAGTLIGQLVWLFTTPVLTRLYEPSAFAQFALFMSLVTAVAPAVSGRYEMALMVVSDQNESRRLLNIALLLAAVLSTVVWFVLSALQWLNITEQFRSLDYFFYLVPVGIFITAAISSLRNYALAKHEHSKVAQFAVIQPTFAAAFGILLGLMGYEHSGLLASTLLGLGFTFLVILRHYHGDLIGEGLALTRNKLKLAKRHKDFPLFSAPASLLDGLGIALPVIFLTKYYPMDVVGYYALITRVAMAPLNFVSQSVAQLNLRKVATILHQNQDPSLYLLKISLMLMAVASGPMLILTTWGKEIFLILFGSDWEIAGELIAILLPSIAIRFIASTLSGSMIASGHLKLTAIWQVLSIVVTGAMFLTVGSTATVRQIFEYIMMTDLFLYSIYIIFIAYSIKRPRPYL